MNKNCLIHGVSFHQVSTNLPVSLFVSFTCCLWISNKIRINNKRTTKQNVNNDGCFVFNLIFYTSFQMKNHCTGIGQYSLDFPFSLVKNVFVDCLDVLVEFELPVRSNIRSRHDMTPEKLDFWATIKFHLESYLKILLMTKRNNAGV